MLYKGVITKIVNFRLGRYLEELIFPKHMRFQATKFSASGQELGSTLLFARRVGFSGARRDLDRNFRLLEVLNALLVKFHHNKALLVKFHYNKAFLVKFHYNKACTSA